MKKLDMRNIKESDLRILSGVGKKIIEFAREELGLQNREAEVVRWVLEGWSNKQVSELLCIAEKTVKFHLTNVYKKLKITKRAELIWKFPIDRLTKEVGDFEKEVLRRSCVTTPLARERQEIYGEAGTLPTGLGNE